MELLQTNNEYINTSIQNEIKHSIIEISDNNDFIKQESDIHVSVIKPITKKIIRCTETKINAYYKPVELVEEKTTYVNKGDEYLVKLYEDLKKKGKAEEKQQQLQIQKVQINKINIQNKNTNLKALNFRNIFNCSNNNSSNNKPFNEVTQQKKNFKLFKDDDIIPKIETVFIPKLDKHVEIVNNIKENVNVDFTYMVPKPINIPVEVPVLKFKDNFKIVPIRKKIIPVIKYSDEVIYVDCLVEKPYIVMENVVVPIPFDVPIEENKYVEKAPPILNDNIQ